MLYTSYHAISHDFCVVICISKCSKISNTFPFLSSKHVGYLGWNSQNNSHAKQTGKTLIRLLLQKQSDQGLPCLSRLLWQATTVWNLRTFTVKTIYSDILYNSKILYNVNCICTNVPVYLKFEFIATEIQTNVNFLGDKHCCCKEGWLYHTNW